VVEQWNHTPYVGSSILSFMNMYKQSFLSLISYMLLASTLALFELSNPIYVIVLLIVIFLLGSFLLLFFQYQYFALLYMVVYVGAILVLFLFVIMMLEIRQLNIQQSFLVFINQKN
jgi:NADH-quinone oxidoreductase subunit J